MKQYNRKISILLTIVLIFGVVPQSFIFARLSNVANHVVISQIYGGGGNSGAHYKNDFIELYNPTSQPISLDGWSVQYASKAGKFETNSTNLEGTIPAYGYYLIQQGAGAGGSEELPTPDKLGTINMAGAAAKVALVNNTLAISGINDENVVDFVGFGLGTNESEGTAGPAASNTQSIARSVDWVDTDDNGADFVAQAPNPRNSHSPINKPTEEDTGRLTISHTPTLQVTTGQSISIDFETSQYVTTSCVYVINLENQVTTSGAYIIDTGSGTHFNAIIPASDINKDEVQYYIEVSNDSDTVRKPQEGYYTVKIEEEPKDETVKTIRDAKNSGTGQVVTVEGVALNDYIPSASSLGCYIQDDTAGILLFDKNIPALSGGTIKAGDYIRVTGKTDEFNGKFELVSLTEIEVLKQGVAVKPIKVAIDAIGEAYEGRLVKLSMVNLDQNVKDNYNNATLTLSKNDMTARSKLDSRRGDNYDDVANKVTVNDLVDVTGIVEENSGKYTIQLRDAQDINKCEVIEGEAIAEDLFISEYVHGGGYNKALELYNGTGEAIDLGQYSIYLYSNGSQTPTTTLTLTGTLENKETYVIVHNRADVSEELQAKADLKTNKLDSLTGKNAIALAKNNIVIDVVGKIGEKPGDNGWVSGDYSTYKKTLVRNYAVIGGSTAFAFSEWDLFDMGDYAHLGEHTMRGNTVDTEAPTIEVSPLEKYNIARDLVLEAKVIDERRVDEVTLYYRNAGETTYNNVEMPQKRDEAGKVIRDSYEGVIPKEALKVGLLECYVKASDGTNEVTYPADANTPLQLNLVDEDIDGPVIKDYTPKSGQVLDKEIVRPVISGKFEDRTGVDLTTVVLKIDGKVIPNELIEIDETGFRYKPVEDMELGTHKVEVSIKDTLGHISTISWTFTIGKVEYNHYRGQLHAHTNISDGTGSLEDAYSYARDRGEADYFAVTDHSNWFDNDKTATLTSHSSEAWQKVKDAADKYNDEGNYVAMAGYEMTWSGSTGGWGHINTFNTEGFYSRSVSKIDLPTYYSEIAKVPESISQLNHPGTTFGDFADFGYYSEEADAVTHLIEVGNGEGPVRSAGYFPSYEYYTRALDKGWHVSPSNNQDNHKGNWITSNDARTIILSKDLTRESLYDAIRNNRVYSSEDKNLEMTYYVNGNVMGTVMDAPEALNISVTARDIDEGDTIKKVSIIANGGTVVASQEFNDTQISWDITLDPSYSYYYVRIEQEDRDIAVSSPVWIGEVVPFGLSKVEASQSPTIVGETIDLTATAYNNGKSSLNDVKVEYFVGSMSPDNKIGEGTIASVGVGDTASCSIRWKPKKAGNYDIYAVTSLAYNGVVKSFSTSQRVVVKDAVDVTKVIIDAGHQNQYVSGDYAGKYTVLKNMLSDKDMVLFENTEAFTDDTLEGASILIITSPQRVSKPDYGLTMCKLADEEIEAIANFVKSGGSVILAGRADYGDASATASYDYQTAVQYNKLLEAIDSNLRLNDDQVVDYVINSGDAYRLHFNNYASKLYDLTPVPENMLYSFYSGCSVVLKDDADESKVDWLVKGHETTEISDADKAGDAVQVQKGNVNAIGAEELEGGGKVIVAGSTFFSDFEVTGDDVTANAIVTKSILDWMNVRPEIPVESIAAVRIDENGDNRADRFGEKVAVEGIVMSESESYSKANGRANAFFETIYVQDGTAGITVFGVSQTELPIGSKVRIIGRIDEYQGDTEIAISNEQTDLIILEDTLQVVPPKVMSTGESMLERNEGWLVQVKGKVTKMIGTSLYVDDGTGEANVYIEGYIGNGNGDKDSLGKWDESIKVGDTVSAIGFCSEGLGNEKRLRVRNTSEIVKLTDEDHKPGGGEDTDDGSDDNSSTVTEKPEVPNSTESKVTIEELEKGEKDLVVTQQGIEVTINQKALLESLVGDDAVKEVVISVAELTDKERESLMSKVSDVEKDKFKNIGSQMIQFEMNTVDASNSRKVIDKLENPMAFKVDLKDAKFVDASKLTAIQYITNKQGEVVVQKLGGVYDEDSKTFTFFTNATGKFEIVEAKELLQINLAIGSKLSSVNGKESTNDVVPQIINQRTMVPLRFIAENLGADVKWDAKEKVATITIGEQTLIMTTKEELEGFDTEPVIVSGRLLVPMRYVSEKLNATVTWFPESKEMLIVK